MRAREAYVEDIDRDFVWVRDGGICGICGTPADPDRWDLDHIVPLARGGLHEYANVQVSHPPCNRKKGARMHKKETQSQITIESPSIALQPHV